MSFVNVAVGVAGAYSSLSSGRYAKGQAYLEASQMDYQAKVERDNALETARIIRRAGHRQVAQANAAYAGAGVVVGEGSAGEVERQISQDVEHDAFQSLLEGSRRARGLETQAQMTRIQGNLQMSAARVQAVNSFASSMAKGMNASGWRTAGPGFSGQQAPAPVTDLSTYGPGTRRY